MRLRELTAGFDVVGDDVEVLALTEDSRRVTPGALFVAVSGLREDGHRYISDALARGAVAIAAERVEGIPARAARIRVDSSRDALATLAARFYGHPARGLHLIGFTGTFGKTSTSDVLRQLLDASQRRPGVGLMGSLGATFGSFVGAVNGLTTPAPVELHRGLRGLCDAGADTVIMEVTSHALRMRRVAGLRFDGGLLAAICAGEHTDFHRSFDDYVAAKRLFLDYLTPDAVLAYDADNDAARELAASRRTGRLAGFSFEGRPAELQFTDVVLDASGARFTIRGPLTPHPRELRSALLGAGHLRNVALALTYALAAGVDLERAADVLGRLQPLRRRMERYSIGGRTVLDDTAAHPDSFRATFDVARLLPRKRLVIVYAIRGSRGIDINARNARSLATLASRHGADALLVTAARDATSDADRVTDAEMDATSEALRSPSCGAVLTTTLDEAVAKAAAATGPGDVILLVGAQGMNEGRRMLEERIPPD